MTRCILAFVPLFWSVLSVFGTVEEFGTRELVQPDGTRITTRAYSDEFGYYLSTANGYVVKDSATGYFHYLRYDSSGRRRQSTLRAGIDDGSEEMARLKRENVQAFRTHQQQRAGLPSENQARTVSPVSSSVELIVILVEFSDVKHQNSNDEDDPDWPMAGLPGPGKDAYPEYTVQNFADMLFGNDYVTDEGVPAADQVRSPDGEAVFGSMRQYWQDMSCGNFTLNGRIANQVREDDPNIPIWVTLDESKSYYHERSRAHFRQAALAAAVSQQTIDVSRNENRVLCIIYAGNMYAKTQGMGNDSGGLHPMYERDLFDLEGEARYNYTMSERWAGPPTDGTPSGCIKKGFFLLRSAPCHLRRPLKKGVFDTVTHDLYRPLPGGHRK